MEMCLKVAAINCCSCDKRSHIFYFFEQSNNGSGNQQFLHLVSLMYYISNSFFSHPAHGRVWLDTGSGGNVANHGKAFNPLLQLLLCWKCYKTNIEKLIKFLFHRTTYSPSWVHGRQMVREQWVSVSSAKLGRTKNVHLSAKTIVHSRD